MSLPSRSEQAMRIKNILTKGTFKTTQNAYLISFAWFRRWKASVGYDGPATNQVVPAIDNSSLVGPNGELKKALVEHGDYEVIPAEAWNLFKTWYHGGPEIPRQVEFDPVLKRNVAVMQLSTFNVKYGEITKPVRVSKFKTVLELKKAACRAFQIPLDLATLYETWNGQKDKELDDEKVIAKLFLKERQLFIIEIDEKLNTGKPVKQTKKRIEVVDDDEEDQQVKMARNRSSVELLGVPGYCGMINLGNTCFLNAALQCVMHARPFVKYFLEGKWKQEVNVQNREGTKGELVTAFADLLGEVWTSSAQAVSPQHLLSVLTKYTSTFRGNREQDAQELLIVFMNLIHEDLNRAKIKVHGHSKHTETKKTKGTDQKRQSNVDEKTLADEAWEKHKAQNDSIVVDLFHGQFRSQLTCPECHSKCLTFEPFSTLSLPIPGQITNSPEFIFVPYDPLQPKMTITLPLRFGYNLVSVKRALSSELRRDVKVVFAIRNARGEFEWLQSPPSERTDGQIICFEIPDQSKVYALTSIYVRKKGMIYDWDDLVDDLMLVQMDKQYPSPEQLHQYCEKRFAYLWSTHGRMSDVSEAEMLDTQTPQLIDFISSLRPIDSSERLICEMDRTAERTRRVPYIAATTLKVKVNPAFMNAQNGFRWNRFFRPLIKKDCECRETTAPTLDNCMKQFACGSTLDESNKWSCEHCRKLVTAEKSIELWKAPEILTIHLKRFAHGYGGSKKLTCNVSYPDILDMNRYIVGEGGVRYRLFGVCEHHGDLAGGHYTAHIKNQDNQKWYFFNDSVCRMSDQDDPHNEHAYLLFYERIH